jgi:putative endonuclease
MIHNYYVYITTNPGKSVLYAGITNDLNRRMIEHYQSRSDPKTFVGKYYCYNLIYYEYFTDIVQAIYREKEIKNMTNKKKKELINSTNPNWKFIRI